MKKKIIFSIVLLFAMVGCFEDNGNYNYDKVEAIKVSTPSSIVFTVGETKEIVSEIKLPQGYTTSFDYEWKVNGEVVSRDAKLNYTAKKIGGLEGFILITDKKTGAKYNNRFYITVNPYYLNGFVVLSENGANNSELHFLRAVYLRGNSSATPPIPDMVEYVGEKQNIYSEINSAALEGRPVSITEHFGSDDNGTVFGEITVITDKNGSKKVIELNGSDMTKAIGLEQEFTNGALPASFNPKTVFHSCWDSYILNSDSYLYPRRSGVKETYHTGYFDKDTKLYGNTKFTDLIPTFYKNTNAILAIKLDPITSQRNYTAIYCDDYSNRRNGLELAVLPTGPSVNPSHFMNITDEIVCSDFFSFDENYDSDINIQSVLLKNTSGQYILHTYSWERPNYTSVVILKSQQINLTTDKMMAKVNGMITLKNRFVTLVYDDNSIYYSDFNLGGFGTIHTFAGKKIVSIASQSQHRVGALEYQTHLAVAFDDGSVEIWEFAHDDITKFSKKVYQSTANFGKIKQIIYKVGNDGEYFEQ